MSRCTATTRSGQPCKGIAIHGSAWCVAHHPEYASARQRGARTGGQRGGRGRSSKASSELARLQRRFEALADKVLAGEVERGSGAVAAQLLNGARSCVAAAVKAREVEEISSRMDALEDELGARQEERRRV